MAQLIEAYCKEWSEGMENYTVWKNIISVDIEGLGNNAEDETITLNAKTHIAFYCDIFLFTGHSFEVRFVCI